MFSATRVVHLGLLVVLMVGLGTPAAALRGLDPDPAVPSVPGPSTPPGGDAWISPRSADRVSSLALPAGSWHILNPDAVQTLAVGRSLPAAIGSPDPEAGALVAGQVRAWLEPWLPRPHGAREGLEEVAVRPFGGSWSAVFRRTVDGVPVLGERVAVTAGPDGAVCALLVRISSGEIGDHLPYPDATSALAVARGYLSAYGVREEVDRGRILVPAADEEIPLLVPSRRVEIRCEEPFGRWLVSVAGDGRILDVRNLIRTASIRGRVDITADEVSYCEGESVLPAGQLDLTVIDSRITETTTLESGSFLVRWFGLPTVTVESRLEGPYVRVDLWNSGADALMSEAVLPDIENVLLWDDGNSRPDERDAFHFVNRAHEQILAIDPAFRDMDFAIPAFVGITDSHCPGNAWYDYGTLNFCEAGSGLANTATIGSIVYHEYAHGITDELYYPLDPPGDVDEGNSDFFSNLLTGESVIARGFWVANCAAGVRNSDNNLVWPEDWTGENHESGRILAGVLWDVWERLEATLPPAEAWAKAAALWHGSRVLGLPATMPEQVAWLFVADDDNGDLTDGTPDWPLLAAAAEHHGFVPPPITYGIDIVHEPLPDGLEQLFYVVTAQVTAGSAPLDVDALRLFYRTGGDWIETPLIPYGGADVYTAAILPGDHDGTIEYYLQASDVLGRTMTLPAKGPAAPFAFAILGDVILVHENFESETGWTVGWPGDAAYAGVWERAVPQLVDGAGVVSQPGADTTPDPGSLCFVTGAAVGSGPGSYDVDGGATSLVSPVYDLRALTSACVQFDAWIFSGYNTTDLEPFTLWVSDDAGAAWTQALSVVRLGAWERFVVPLDGLVELGAQVRFRFVIQDPLPAALVEALVDEFSIIGYEMPDLAAPQVTLIAPRGRVLLPVETVRTIVWSAVDDGILERCSVLLSRDGGATYPDTLLRNAPYVDHLDWLVTGPPTASARLKVLVTDLSGKTGQAVSSTPFTILATSPGLLTGDSSGLDEITPNPFNPSTTVAFRLRAAQPVDAAVYDLTGRLVRRLHAGILPAGAHRLVWDGRGEGGGTVSSGTYLLRLVARDFQETRKLTLLK